MVKLKPQEVDRHNMVSAGSGGEVYIYDPSVSWFFLFVSFLSGGEIGSHSTTLRVTPISLVKN